MRTSTAIMADLALRLGGVRAAARAAGVPASSISSALDRTEAALGVTLARRSEDGIAPTVATTSRAGGIARIATLCREMHGLADIPGPASAASGPQKAAASAATAGGDNGGHRYVPVRPVGFLALFRLAQALRIGSVRRAAAEMGLSQPQLTRQLAQLEVALGGGLVRRGPQGICPTPEGQRLLGRIERLETEWRRLIGAAEPDHSRASRRYAMGAVIPAGPDGDLAELLSRIARDLPLRHGLRLSIASAIAEDLLAGLDSGRFDAVIVDTRLTGPARRQHLMAETGVALVGPDLPARAGDRAALRRALMRRPLALQSSASGLRQCAEAFLDSAAGPDWRHIATVIEVDSLPVIVNMARSGAALSVLPLGATAGFGADGPRILPLARRYALAFWLTWRDRPKADRLAAAIIDA